MRPRQLPACWRAMRYQHVHRIYGNFNRLVYRGGTTGTLRLIMRLALVYRAGTRPLCYKGYSTEEEASGRPRQVRASSQDGDDEVVGEPGGDGGSCRLRRRDGGAVLAA